MFSIVNLDERAAISARRVLFGASAPHRASIAVSASSGNAPFRKYVCLAFYQSCGPGGVGPGLRERFLFVREKGALGN